MNENILKQQAGRLDAHDFEIYGRGYLGYVKEISLEEALQLNPEILGMPEGIKLYALHDADGAPMSITDSRDAALVSAFENDLEALSLH